MNAQPPDSGTTTNLSGGGSDGGWGETPSSQANNRGSPAGKVPTTPVPLKPLRIVLLAVAAVAAFHLGFLYAALSWLVFVWLGCLFALRRTSCGRWAFYTGLAIGLGIYGPQLAFFWNIFGPAAIALWLVLAFWLALFVLLLHGVDRYWGTRWAVVLAPVLWLGLEYFRSELYYLRFAWFTAGSVLPAEWWLSTTGVYGLGAVMTFLAAATAVSIERRLLVFSIADAREWLYLVGMLVILVVFVLTPLLPAGPGRPGRSQLVVAGIQLEFPRAGEVLEALERARVAEPKAPQAQPALYLLSEYTFDGPVPDEIRAWCREKQRWLVAGGKEPIAGGGFHNTAFVVSTNGEVVFQQAKTVPIQFFNDGVPAPEQRVWDSPWGRIGIAICYDLSYARVVDRLIRQGAQALLVPAMDTVAWGGHQHHLNARMTPIRAAEYGVPVFRVASSGISQLVDRHGNVRAQLPFPGQGEVLRGQLALRRAGQTALPLDRHLAPIAVIATFTIAGLLAWQQRRARRGNHLVHPAETQTP